MPDDYARKNYSDKQYNDWMRSRPAKSIWNQILESNPGTGEFSGILRGSPLSRSVQRYIQQSEFKKPNTDNDFVGMEGDWEGPGGGIPYEPGGPDIPTNLQNPGIPIADAPSRTVFIARIIAGGWCPDLEKEITISTSEPTYRLTITFSQPGSYISNQWGTGQSISVPGLNMTTFTLFVPPEMIGGFVTVEASMRSSEGIPGDSNVNVYKDNCDIPGRFAVVSGYAKDGVDTGTEYFIVYDLKERYIATNIPASATPGDFVSFPCEAADLQYAYSNFLDEIEGADSWVPPSEGDATGSCGYPSPNSVYVYMDRSEVQNLDWDIVGGGQGPVLCNSYSESLSETQVDVWFHDIDCGGSIASELGISPSYGYDLFSAGDVSRCGGGSGHSEYTRGRERFDYIVLTNPTWGTSYCGIHLNYDPYTWVDHSWSCEGISNPPLQNCDIDQTSFTTLSCDFSFHNLTSFLDEKSNLDIVSGNHWDATGNPGIQIWDIDLEYLHNYFHGMASYETSGWMEDFISKTFLQVVVIDYMEYTGPGGGSQFAYPAGGLTEGDHTATWNVVWGDRTDEGSTDFDPRNLTRNATFETAIAGMLHDSTVSLGSYPDYYPDDFVIKIEFFESDTS